MSVLQIVALIWAALTLIGLVGVLVLNPIVDKKHPNAIKALWGLFWGYRKKYKLLVLATIFTPFSFILFVRFFKALLDTKRSA